MSAFYWFSKHHVDDAHCHRRPCYDGVALPSPRGKKKGKPNTLASLRDLLRNTPTKFWLPAPHLEHYFAMPRLQSRRGFTGAPVQLVIFNKYEAEWYKNHRGPPAEFH